MSAYSDLTRGLFLSGFKLISGVPKGSRTPVIAVKGRCPRPLDDGDLELYYDHQIPDGGARRDRTADLLHAMQALSQLSYNPKELGSGSSQRERDST